MPVNVLLSFHTLRVWGLGTDRGREEEGLIKGASCRGGKTSKGKQQDKDEQAGSLAVS